MELWNVINTMTTKSSHCDETLVGSLQGGRGGSLSPLYICKFLIGSFLVYMCVVICNNIH